MNDEEVKEAVAKTVKKVLLDAENEKKKQERQKVLHNTRMLMENYREMRRHLKNAISEVEELEAEEFQIFKTGKSHLESVRRSKLCTAMMIANIDRAMEELKAEQEEKGAKQVSGAISASTLTTVCVFAPIVFTEGITRQLFVDMGLTIAYSLLASLLIALTFVPMMGAGLLKKTKDVKHPWFDRFQEGYGAVLEKLQFSDTMSRHLL